MQVRVLPGELGPQDQRVTVSKVNTRGVFVWVGSKHYQIRTTGHYRAPLLQDWLKLPR